MITACLSFFLLQLDIALKNDDLSCRRRISDLLYTLTSAGLFFSVVNINFFTFIMHNTMEMAFYDMWLSAIFNEIDLNFSICKTEAMVVFNYFPLFFPPFLKLKFHWWKVLYEIKFLTPEALPVQLNIS